MPPETAEQNAGIHTVSPPPQSLLAPPDRVELLKRIAGDLPDISLNERQMCDLELLATGAFTPLAGFMIQADYESVLHRMRLQNGNFFPLPVVLDLPSQTADRLEAGQSAALRDPEGFLLAVLHIDDIWPADYEAEAEAVFGTADDRHPGVRRLKEEIHPVYAGGRLEVISLPLHFDFQQLRRTPSDVRDIMKQLEWKRMAGFHLRTPLHRTLFELSLKAMRTAGANLLLMPSAGVTRSTDFDHYTRIRCYREAGRRYPPDTHLLNLLPLAGRQAGVREALLHAVIARNYGCTHFIIGHRHCLPDAFPGAGPAASGLLKFSDPENPENQAMLDGLSTELGIELMRFPEMVYLPYEDEFRLRDDVPPKVQTVSFSGYDFWNRIRAGRQIPEWATFPEVVAEIQRTYPPPRRQGLTVFFTGLSGAGKSTLAKILYSRFMELGDRPVTLLDGDIVRQNLSRELNFSREHRDINVRRIGFVAAEITKNRGVAICAPIAPYERTRREIRDLVETHGGFIEVHVSTPLEICEGRDRKGMYAKARAGLIKGFTGVDDPYEPPDTPEIRLNTAELSPNEAVKQVMLVLNEKGYI